MVRLRHRYIIGKINYGTKPRRKIREANKSNILLNALMKTVRDLHGIHGAAVVKSGLFVYYFHTDTEIFYIRLRRKVYPIISSSLSFMKSLNSEPISIQTLYTGATIRHCNLFLVKYYRRELETMYKNIKTPKQKEEYEMLLEQATTKPLKISFLKTKS